MQPFRCLHCSTPWLKSLESTARLNCLHWIKQQNSARHFPSIPQQWSFSGSMLQFYAPVSPLPLKTAALCHLNTHPNNPCYLIHPGALHGETSAAFFRGSSNNRHKVLWAVGVACTAVQLNLKPYFPFNLMMLLVKSVHFAAMEMGALEEIIHIKVGTAATFNANVFDILLLSIHILAI